MKEVPKDNIAQKEKAAWLDILLQKVRHSHALTITDHAMLSFILDDRHSEDQVPWQPRATEGLTVAQMDQHLKHAYPRLMQTLSPPPPCGPG